MGLISFLSRNLLAKTKLIKIIMPDIPLPGIPNICRIYRIYQHHITVESGMSEKIEAKLGDIHGLVFLSRPPFCGLNSNVGNLLSPLNTDIDRKKSKKVTKKKLKERK